jgi:hypothetical protein
LNCTNPVKYTDEDSVFVLGSPYETQCLAALEAASRNLPIVMPRTGILGNLPEHLQGRVGEFGEDLPLLLSRVLEKLQLGHYQPREVIDELGLLGESRYRAWEDYLLAELQQSFINTRGRLSDFRANILALLLTPVWRGLKVSIRTLRVVTSRVGNMKKKPN